MLDMLIQGVASSPGRGRRLGHRIVGRKSLRSLSGRLTAEAAQVIDARGKIVVPGGIETHAHAVANVQPGARMLVPGFPTPDRSSTRSARSGRNDDGHRFRSGFSPATREISPGDP